MFISLANYSPKNLLANYLSRSLAKFFDVDPNRVQTNLVQDAKVILNDITIKERQFGSSSSGDACLKVSGVIEQIEFAWVWDSSALIKDVKLTIRGVSVHVTVADRDDEVQEDNALPNINSEEIIGDVKVNAKNNDGSEGEPKDWKAKYLKQIIDHLTLAVTDATVTTHMNNEEALFVRTKGVELVTLQAREGGDVKDASALLQAVCMASIEAWIENKGDTSLKYPILEPFGYSANVTRISGRRFLDGVLSGLLVEGRTQADSSNAPPSIRVHAGIQQIAGLNRLQQVLLLVGQGDNVGGDNDSVANGPTDPGVGMKSIFRLPFQSMEVILENETNLRLVACNIDYCTDGSELTVACTGGVWVDDSPLSNDSRMILDLVSSEFLLDSLPSKEQYDSDFFYSTHADGGGVPMEAEDGLDDEPLQMNLSLDIFQRIYSGIKAIMSQCTEAMETMEKAMPTTHPSSSNSTWSVRSTKPLAFRFTGTANDWVQIIVKGPKASKGPTGSVQFECAAIDVSSSLGFAVHVPRVKTEENGCFLVEYRASATIKSTDTFNVLQNMYCQVLDVIGSEESASNPSTPSTHFELSLGGLDITLEEPQLGTVHLSRIRGSGEEFSVGVVQVKDIENVSFTARYLKATLDTKNNKKELFVQKIKHLSYNKVQYLVHPIEETAIMLEGGFQGGHLTIACKDVHVTSLPQNNAPSASRGELLALPVTLHLTANRIRIEDVAAATKAEVEALNVQVNPSAESLMVDLSVKNLKGRAPDIMKEFGPGKPGLSFDGLQLHVSPNENTKSIDVHAQCSYLQGRSENQADYSAKGIKLSLSKLLENRDKYLGLKEATISMKEISTLSIPGSLKLAKPITNPSVQLKNDSISANCDIIHVMYTHCSDQASPENATLPHLPIPLSVFVKQVIVKDQTSEVVCNQLSVHYMQATASSRTLRIGIVSSFGMLSGTNSYDLNGLNFSSKWQDAPQGKTRQIITFPYLGSLSFAQVEVDTCNQVSTSMFSLLNPIEKQKLLIQEGFLVLELGEVGLRLINDFGSSDSRSELEPISLSLSQFNFPIGFNTSKLRIKTPGGDDFCFENVGIDYVMNSPKVEMYIHCDSLVESKIATAKNFDLNLHLNLSGTGNTLTLGMDSVEKASMKIGKIESLYLDGMGCLSRPMQNTVVTYQDGILATDIESLQVECFYSQPSLALALRKLSLRTQSDPFDKTIRVMVQCDTFSGHGDVSFGATGIDLVTTVVRTSMANLGHIASSSTPDVVKSGSGYFAVGQSKPIAIPSVGYVSLIVLDIKEMPMVSAQNMRLKTPITNMSLRFENDVISIDCPAINLHQSAVKSSHSQNDGGSTFELPCKATLSTGVFRLFQFDKMQTVVCEKSCVSLSVALEPANKPNQSGPMLKFQAIGSDFNSIQGTTAFESSRLSASGLIDLNNTNTVRNLSVGIEKAQLAAEFSSQNWSLDSLQEDEESSADAKLPFAVVPKLDLTLKYVGALMNINNATIACDAYQGNARTSLSVLIDHYANIAKSRIPYLLLAKADIAGCNVGDSIGSMAGRVLTHTSVVGATAGFVGRDAVGSTLTMGKESRGGTSSDKYKFGDFTRGAVSSVKRAAKSGSEMRGDDEYMIGDVTAGALNASGNYAVENRCRLAGAGGSAYGMIAGAALLGPVGFVAGSLIGGAAAKSGMGALTGDPKKEKQRIEEQAHYSAALRNATAQQHQSSRQVSSSNQAPDLLSSDNTLVPPQQAFQRQSNYTGTTQSNVYQQHSQNRDVSQYHARQSQHQVYASATAPPAPASSRNVSQYPAHQSHRQVNSQAAPNAAASTAPQANRANNEKHGYRFGDITKGVVAKGKAARGEENSGYKFGDFTRGLFG